VGCSLGQFFLLPRSLFLDAEDQATGFHVTLCKTIGLLSLLFSFLLFPTEQCISVMKINGKGSEVPVGKKSGTVLIFLL
jgi:hypothetical protein